MSTVSDSKYYIRRKDQLLQAFREQAQQWHTVLSRCYGEQFTQEVLDTAFDRFQALIPQLPYIGGDENYLTSSLIGSAECLAFFHAMDVCGKNASEAGKVMFDAILEAPLIPAPESPLLDRDVLMQRRKERALRSQRRQYEDDWIYEFVEGDGVTFDYGYDFTQCVTQIFYVQQNAEIYLPFYCYLDFPKCEKAGLCLSRTMTLAEGDVLCNFRFKEDGKAQCSWPPPFLKE